MPLSFTIKSHFSKNPALLCLISLTTYTMACSNMVPTNGAEQSKPAAKTEHKIGDSDTDFSNLNDEDAIDANASEVFSVFCERAAATSAIAERLSEYFEHFCVDGVPTKLLTSTLVESAYAGQGDPVVKKVQDWRDDPNVKTTTGFVGVGIKLPISIQEHFEELAPLAGKEATIAATAEAFGGTSEIARVLQPYKKQGEYHIRGWSVEQRASKKLEALQRNVHTHTINRMDHYELEKGSIYLYTQYVEESKETIKDMMMITAGIKLGNESYLLTISRVVLANQGFHPLAVEAIKTGATGLSKLNYDAAAEDQ